MRKYKWIIFLVLIGCTITFFACERGQQMLETVLPDPEPQKWKPNRHRQQHQ